ncbi:hypothetical protein VE00_08958 [Pseudogymnoascus sp. WSF 3629]|nr:hypothetical protein VE00_08958 [Pseudogymnoascus sp. WSF 3629]
MEKIKIPKVEGVQALSNGGQQFKGTLHLTNHHLIYSCKRINLKGGDPLAQKTSEFWITYHIISRCTFRPTAPGSAIPSNIRIRGRDFSSITFNFDDPVQAKDVFESIKGLTCRLKRINKLYAYRYKGNPKEDPIKGWEIYDARAEWKRQGISEKGIDQGWRISTINSDYAFSPTYPALLVVPTSISDNVLNYAAKFRSKARIPALTYLHPVNNCSITRSAQPGVGIRSARSVQDEKLVGACFSASDNISAGSTPEIRSSPTASQLDIVEISNEDANMAETDTERLEDMMIATADDVGDQPRIYGAQRRNLIVDARPTVNALAQHAAGFGSENMDNYKFAAKAYLGIDNIHVMRNSLRKVVEALKDGDLTPLPPNRELLAKSNWLKHIANILDGSALIARQVGIHHSHVLIHCSDGWDRTSQLSALSQIMLDPYYRTLDGFIVLIEKDWLAFGHMFQHRNGYLNSEKWFTTEYDGLAGSSVQPGLNDAPRNETIENALAKTKRFFTKRTPTDEVDSDGEPIYEEAPGLFRAPAKGTPEEEEATKENETSPVFHQFLDAVYQLLRQHPKRFEFNQHFLRRLLYHTYSCQYGTFLHNNEKARLDAQVSKLTRSVWDYIIADRPKFVNPDWDGGEINDHVRGKERLLFPRLEEVKWWFELFGKTDEEMNGPSIPPVEQFHQKSASRDASTGVLTEVETANSDMVSGDLKPDTAVNASPRQLNSGNAVGLSGLRSSLSNLSIGGIAQSQGGSGTRTPASRKQEESDVEMQ